MCGGGFFDPVNLLSIGATALAPEFGPAMGLSWFGPEATFGEQLLANMALGGGISALTGGNIMTGALGGGLNAALRNPSALADLGKTGTPAAMGTNTAGGMAGPTIAGGTASSGLYYPESVAKMYDPLFQAGQASTAIAGQVPSIQAGQAYMGAPDFTVPSAPQIAGQVPSAVSQAGQSFMGAPSALGQTGNYGITSNGLAADLASSGGASAADIASQAATKAVASGDTSPGLFDNVSDWWTNLSPSKKLLYGGGAALGVMTLMQPKPVMPTLPQINAPQFGLAANYQRTPNPTPVYPRAPYAKGGEVRMAEGGLSDDQVANNLITRLSKVDNPLASTLGSMALAFPQNVAYTLHRNSSNSPEYQSQQINPNEWNNFGYARGLATAGTPGQIEAIRGMAEGGIAQLAGGGDPVDFMGNDMYPMSQQKRSFYATPSQMPTSAQQVAASYEPQTNPLTGTPVAHMASGGISSLGGYSDGGRMLRGPGDGMSDSIPGVIANKRPARLADGEFVVPADVVSHLGNGSTDAGAKQLYAMMDRVRQARTGKKVQGKQINPRKLMTA